MSRKKPDGFSLIVPDEQEPERDMPVTLEVLDYKPGRRRAKPPLGGGAYNPYERESNPGDTARIRRPQIDLRKLSEHIKTTQQVKALREEDLVAADKPRKA
jgi:hypothetical protein